MPAINRSQSTDLGASPFSQSAVRLNVFRSNRRKAPVFPALLRWLCRRSPSELCRLPPLTEKPRRAVSTNPHPCRSFSIAVETLGEAFSYGWRVTARCAAGKKDGMHRHKECLYRAELDLETSCGSAA